MTSTWNGRGTRARALRFGRTLLLVSALVGCDDDDDELSSDGGSPLVTGPDGGSVDARSLRADASPGSGADAGVPGEARPAVLTFHNDNARTGANLRERELTAPAVLARGMALRVSRPLDKAVDTQVLFVPALDTRLGVRDVVYVATRANTVYAYDADDDAASGTDRGLVWKRTLIDPEDRVARPQPRGIQSTPVIDLAAGELYVVYSTKDVVDEPFGESNVNAAFFLAALDLGTGALRRTVKLEGTARRNDGSTLAFLARNHRQRPALLLTGGDLYIAFGARSKENLIEYHGWVLRYDAATFAAEGTFCTTPNWRGPELESPANGGGIWQSGAGLVADAAGNAYVVTGNAFAELDNDSYGNSILKLARSGGSIDVAAAFTPDDPLRLLQLNDVDLGSGGAMLLPGTNRLVGGGKTGILYLLETSTMAKRQEFQAFLNVYDPTFPVDSAWEGGPHLHGGPVFWQGADPTFATIYHWGEQDYLKAYKYIRSTGLFDAARPRVGATVGLEGVMPGGILSLSANGTVAQSGIVWALVPEGGEPDPIFGALPGRLQAYDAELLALLWETSISTMPKWVPPTVADGKVFVPTVGRELLVYELGPP